MKYSLFRVFGNLENMYDEDIDYESDKSSIFGNHSDSTTNLEPNSDNEFPDYNINKNEQNQMMILNDYSDKYIYFSVREGDMKTVKEYFSDNADLLKETDKYVILEFDDSKKINTSEILSYLVENSEWKYVEIMINSLPVDSMKTIITENKNWELINFKDCSLSYSLDDFIKIFFNHNEIIKTLIISDEDLNCNSMNNIFGNLSDKCEYIYFINCSFQMNISRLFLENTIPKIRLYEYDTETEKIDENCKIDECYFSNILFLRQEAICLVRKYYFSDYEFPISLGTVISDYNHYNDDDDDW